MISRFDLIADLGISARFIRSKVLSPIRLAVLLISFGALQPSPLRADPPSFPGIPADRTVSVTAFGANGSDALDDTAAIQQAIDSVASQGGGTVMFPAGTYIVNTAQDGFRGAVWLKSHVRLLGVGGRQSILKLLAGSGQNRNAVTIGDPTYLINEGPPLIVNPTKWQDDIEIAYLGFDLDNNGGRRAIQLRYATRNVRVHHCEGFQSGIEAGEPINPAGIGRDKSFL